MKKRQSRKWTWNDNAKWNAAAAGWTSWQGGAYGLDPEECSAHADESGESFTLFEQLIILLVVLLMLSICHYRCAIRHENQPRRVPVVDRGVQVRLEARAEEEEPVRRRAVQPQTRPDTANRPEVTTIYTTGLGTDAYFCTDCEELRNRNKSHELKTMSMCLHCRRRFS